MLVFTVLGHHSNPTRHLDFFPHSPKLVPLLLAGMIDPAAGEMDEQIALLPAHGFTTFGERIDGSLFDHSGVLAEGLMVTDKVGLWKVKLCVTMCYRFKDVRVSLAPVLAMSYA